MLTYLRVQFITAAKQISAPNLAISIQKLDEAIGLLDNDDDT